MAQLACNDFGIGKDAGQRIGAPCGDLGSAIEQKGRIVEISGFAVAQGGSAVGYATQQDVILGGHQGQGVEITGVDHNRIGDRQVGGAEGSHQASQGEGFGGGSGGGIEGKGATRDGNVDVGGGESAEIGGGEGEIAVADVEVNGGVEGDCGILEVAIGDGLPVGGCAADGGFGF